MIILLTGFQGDSRTDLSLTTEEITHLDNIPGNHLPLHKLTCSLLVVGALQWSLDNSHNFLRIKQNVRLYPYIEVSGVKGEA